MKIKLIQKIIIFLIFISIISINSFNVRASDEKYYFKSIIPYGYIPRGNLTMEPLYFLNENTNETIFQNGSKPYVFRNHLIITDFEKVDINFLKSMSLNTIKDQILWKAYVSLLKENISYYYDDIYYLNRWTIFIIVANDTPPIYPQDGLFFSSKSDWQNFISQGYWYINQPQKCIAIWMWRCSLCDNPFGQVQEVTDEITEVIRTTFPYYDLAYLEGNYYIYEYSKLSENCIKNISIATDEKLTTEIEILNNNISQCMIRKARLSIDLSNLFHISAPFYLKYSDFNFVDLIKNDLQDNVDKAIEQNKKNLEILEETKNIIQNELFLRAQHSEVQRDYFLTVFSVLLGGLIAGIATLWVSLYLQKKERIASGASQQRTEFYEPLYNEIVKINQDLTKFKCPFNAKEILTVWENLKPSAKNRVLDSTKEKIIEFNRLGRIYYGLYIRSLEILNEKINSIMNRYRVEGIARGEFDRESLDLRNTFNNRKQALIPEYQSDFFAGRLSGTRGRPSLERLCSMLRNKNITEQHMFNRITSSLSNEPTIIELREAQQTLLTYSQELETYLKDKINNIIDKYENKLKKI